MNSKEKQMNIFVTNKCPHVAASNLQFYHKLANKMILESAQMIFSSLAYYGYETPYRSTHVNHPSSLWCRQSLGNFHWVLSHMYALNEHYRSRSGKDHKSYITVVEYLSEIDVSGIFPSEELTLPHLAMPEQFQIKHGTKRTRPKQKPYYRARSWDDATTAYREYLETKEYAKEKEIIWQ